MFTCFLVLGVFHDWFYGMNVHKLLTDMFEITVSSKSQRCHQEAWVCSLVGLSVTGRETEWKDWRSRYWFSVFSFCLSSLDDTTQTGIEAMKRHLGGRSSSSHLVRQLRVLMFLMKCLEQKDELGLSDRDFLLYCPSCLAGTPVPPWLTKHLLKTRWKTSVMTVVFCRSNKQMKAINTWAVKLTEWWNGWSDITDHQKKKLSYGFCCVAKVTHYQCFAYSLCCFCCCWLFLVCWEWMTHCQSSLTQQSHCTRSIEFVLFFYLACHTDLHHNLCSHCGWKR